MLAVAGQLRHRQRLLGVLERIPQRSGIPIQVGQAAQHHPGPGRVVQGTVDGKRLFERTPRLVEPAQLTQHDSQDARDAGVLCGHGVAAV